MMHPNVRAVIATHLSFEEYAALVKLHEEMRWREQEYGCQPEPTAPTTEKMPDTRIEVSFSARGPDTERQQTLPTLPVQAA
jgi:hypothetical protein